MSVSMSVSITVSLLGEMSEAENWKVEEFIKTFVCALFVVDGGCHVERQGEVFCGNFAGYGSGSTSAWIENNTDTLQDQLAQQIRSEIGIETDVVLEVDCS